MCDFGSLSAGGGFQIRLEPRMTARKIETKNKRRMSGLGKDVTIVPGENINVQSTALMRNMILHSI